MRRQITISIPETLRKSVEGIDNFESFVNKVIIRALQKINQPQNTDSIEAAAELMRKEYATDKELTAFSILDGEAFYEYL